MQLNWPENARRGPTNQFYVLNLTARVDTIRARCEHLYDAPPAPCTAFATATPARNYSWNKFLERLAKSRGLQLPERALDLHWRHALDQANPPRNGNGRSGVRGFFGLIRTWWGVLRLRNSFRPGPNAMIVVWQAYRFALDPNDRQRGRLASHAGAARYAYNLGLQWLKASLEENRNGLGALPAGAVEMHKRWNRWKKDPSNGVSWWSDNSKCVYQEAFVDLERATKTFFASRSGKRNGPRPGFPQFKRKGRSRDHFRLTGAIRIGSSWVQLPKLGTLRVCEDPGQLLRHMKGGTARITAASVSREAQRWYVSFRVERKRHPMNSRSSSDVVGLDVGINALVTVSTGEVFAPPPALRRLRRLSKSHSRKKMRSANRRRSAQMLARCHARIAHLRRDRLHKLTTRLAKSHGQIVIEDLNVRAMLRNHRLARSIADASWGELAGMLEYKCRWYGAKLIRADRFFPSSKTCSRCGYRKETLSLAKRTFSCENCGSELDRDLNAAINLAHWPEVAGSAPETRNACRGDVRPGSRRAVPDEAGTERPTLASGSEPIALAVAISLGQNGRG
jgi:putative transposase